jgi:GH24 family phage-related lysozyme (muramidase)
MTDPIKPSSNPKPMLQVKPGTDLKKPVMPGGKGAAGGAGLILALAIAIGYALDPSEGGRRLDVYLDSSDIPTACKGVIGAEVTRRWRAKGKDARFTDVECDQLENNYTLKMTADMLQCVPEAVVSTLSYGEFIAYGHWAYNTGTGMFCSLGSVPRLLAQGNRIAACNVMAKYTWARPSRRLNQTGRDNGKTGPARRIDCADKRNKCSGLKTRREAEVNTCLAGIG